MRVGYEKREPFDYLFSNQFILNEEQRYDLYSKSVKLIKIPKKYNKRLSEKIYQSSICKTLTQGCYDLENHHFRYIQLVSQDGNFIDNIITKSEMDMGYKYIENCQEHTLNVIRYIEIIEFYNIRNELKHL